MQKLLTFFQQKYKHIYATFNDQSFNDMLTKDIVSFEQLGSDNQLIDKFHKNDYRYRCANNLSFDLCVCYFTVFTLSFQTHQLRTILLSKI